MSLGGGGGCAYSVNVLIQRAKNALLGSVDSDGYPNIKAMLPPRKREGLKVIYFSTNTSSERVNQFRKNSKSSIYFYNPVTFQGAMLKGIIEISESQEDKSMLWLEGDTLYYPLGVTDPDYCVLIFRTQSIRYYSEMISKEFTT